MGAERKTKVGCCGFVVSQQEYFQLFNLIEIQTTFYQLPRLQTAEKWRATAPQGFEFTIKAWQLITHEPSSPTYRRLRSKIDPTKLDHYGSFRVTPEVLEAWNRTAMFALHSFGCTSLRPANTAGAHRAQTNFGAVYNVISQAIMITKVLPIVKTTKWLV